MLCAQPQKSCTAATPITASIARHDHESYPGRTLCMIVCSVDLLLQVVHVHVVDLPLYQTRK